MPSVVKGKKKLGLYLHVPFCRSKCAYCDFFSFVPSNEQLMQRYTDVLALHMESYRDAASEYKVDSVFIGGGTPTVLSIEQLIQINRAVYKNFDVDSKAEYTIEANPATIDLNSLKKLRRAGLNRLSMGLQSADDNELIALSRLHNREAFEKSFRDARRAGIQNINVDLMFGIPRQTVNSFMKTLRYVTHLEPEHISVYGLQIEEGTPFAAKRDSLVLPSDETEYEMYMDAVEYLASCGYEHYEISNFAKPGMRCRHNMKYWNCDEYLGLGASAHSYFNNCRFSFKRDIDNYMNGLEIKNARINLTDENVEISPYERIGEYVMLRMRLSDGIDSRQFFRRFRMNFDELYGNRLMDYVKKGFVTYKNGVYSFTAAGMFVSNYILSDILNFDAHHIVPN